MLNWLYGPLIFGWLFVLVWVPIVVMTQRKTHPKALFTLFFAELWERFSFYGMRALLTLYMTKVLFEQMQQGEADAKAYGIYGAFNALLYGAPVIGGILADRLLGFQRAVIMGGIFMAAGQFTLSGTIGQEMPFFLGLALIIVGNGLFKPNISSFLGTFYDKDDPRKDGAFTIFYMGINIGAFLSPLTCGYLGEEIGWEWGFFAAGVGICLGVIVFWRNMRVYEEKGVPPDVAKLRAPFLLGLSRQSLVIVGALASVPVLALLLNEDVIVDWILIAAGVVILGYLVLAATGNAHWKWKLLVSGLATGLIGYFLAPWLPFPDSWASMDVAAVLALASVPVVMLVTTILHKSGDAASTPLFGTSLTTDEERMQGKRMLVVVVLFFFHMVFWTLFEQAGGSLTILTDRFVNRYGIPTSQFQALNPFYIMVLAPVFSWIWIKLRAAKIEPRTPTKFFLGLVQMAMGYAVIVWGASHAGAAAIPLIFLCLMYLLHTTGELSLSPVGLSVVTKLALPKVVGFVMGTWFLSIAFAHKIAGELGKLVAAAPDEGADQETAIAAFTDVYWTWGVLVVLGSAFVLLCLTPILKKWMHGVH